ncbi:protein-tyrosine-phosphatase [Crocinitomicaceae bacterium]|jgi:arsenate reductase|nr:protein-tyrosine-phosphatase [Crocinitomicaceae bacterium]
MINDKLKSNCNKLISETDATISASRRVVLDELVLFIREELKASLSEGKEVSVVYLCTHNSRRSHFAQVWGHIASVLFDVKNLKTYSGGTVATECHPNTIAALKHIGFEIKCEDLSAANPLYQVYYNDTDFISCYSKANTADSIPQTDFIAVMTCSDSDDNCPLVPGAKKRFSTTYDDPKEFDESENPVPHYVERSLQIASEILYTFQQI